MVVTPLGIQKYPAGEVTCIGCSPAGYPTVGKEMRGQSKRAGLLVLKGQLLLDGTMVATVAPYL